MFHCKRSGKEFKYTCVERGSCMSGKRFVNYLSQIKTCIYLIELNLIVCDCCCT